MGCMSCDPLKGWPTNLSGEPLGRWECMTCGATGIQEEDYLEKLEKLMGHVFDGAPAPRPPDLLAQGKRARARRG